MSKLNDRLRDKDLTLFRDYSFHPADDVSGYLGEVSGKAKTGLKKIEGTFKSGKLGVVQKKLSTIIPAFRPKDSYLFQTDIKYRQMAAGKTVAIVNLKRRTSERAGNEGVDTVDVIGSYNPGAKGVPAYFLPWDSGGAVVSMRIPKKGVISKDSSILDPDIFFTAAINGCSIFIQGEPDNPRVYHAGGDTGRGTDMERGAAFWREVITNFADPTSGKFQTEINKTDYIKTPGQLASDGTLTTANAKAYETWLKDKYKDSLKIQLVNPWGSVFGFRTGANWTFYLQENATVVYLSASKKNGAKMQIVSRPLVVREIYPKDRVMINMKCAIPVTVTAE